MRRKCVRLRLEALESRQLPSVSATPIFSEDFNQPVGSLPSTSTWKYDVGWDPNAATHYVDDSSVLSVVNDPAAVDGSALAISILRGPNDSHGNPTFLSGRINTSIDPVGGNLQYGRVEARIKMPGGPNGQGNGLWPAFWMLGSNFPQVGWPNCGEIDIMENRGTTPGTIQGSLHSGAFFGPRMDPTSFYNLPGGQAFYSSYHVFAVDWSPGSIRFSVDGQVYSTFLASSFAPNVWGFDNHPFFVILNIADGGAFGGPLGPNSTFPQTMYVDYVRAYSLTGISAPTNLTARAVTTNQVNLSWQDAANDETGFLLQRSVTPDFSTTDASFNLAQGTTAFQDTTASPGTTYYYRLQAVATDGTSSYQSDFSDPAVTTTWVDQDVNTTGGSGGFAGGTFTLAGQGGDIGGAADQFNFLSDPVSGDSMLFGRLTGLTNTGPSAKAGLMVRNSAAPDAAFADVVVAPGGAGVRFQWRAADGGAVSSVNVAGVSAPVWLRLVRTGNSFSGFYSTDDVTWTQVGTTQTVALGATALDGLAVTSGNPSALATATFTNVSVGPYVAAAAVALNCVGAAAGEFAADAFFSTPGTLTSHSTAAVDTTGVPDPAPQVVYDSDRYGNHFTYTIPGLTPGATYDVQMHFAENYWTAAGKRVFNVAINGTGVLSGFDIYATAGGAHKALQEDFLALADAGGTITLAFTSTKDNAQINGLRIIPLAPGPTNLSATAASSSEIDLSWTAPSGAVTGYNIYRGTSAGGESATPLNATPVTGTTYQDTTASPATTYYYVVRAVSAAGTSGASNEASATTQGATTGADLALYHPAFASSVENASFPPSNAVDGNSATRWSSQFSDPQWIYVDLGATYTITEVSLNWEHAAGRDYQVQVSDDATNWTTIQSVTGNTTAGVHDYTGLSGTGRYVRVYGTARTTQYGYSLFDFNVYGSDVSPGATPLSRPNWAATASSTEPGGNPQNALDGILTTRWSSGSAMSGGEWFQLDLGSAQTFDRIVLDSGNSVNDYARGYQVLISNNGTDWATQVPVAAGAGTGPVTARYVRIVQTGTASSWWSIAELSPDA
jgi:beta-glucanase (GH16 family)